MSQGYSKWNLRLAEAKAWAREATAKAKEFCNENKQWLIPAGLTVGGAILKMGVTHHKTAQQKKVKDYYCYDPSLGHYWSLNRELSNQEWLEIDRRRKKGERYADILASMRVLK